MSIEDEDEQQFYHCYYYLLLLVLVLVLVLVLLLLLLLSLSLLLILLLLLSLLYLLLSIVNCILLLFTSPGDNAYRGDVDLHLSVSVCQGKGGSAHAIRQMHPANLWRKLTPSNGQAQPG